MTDANTKETAQISDRGYTILDGVIPAAQVDQVRQACVEAQARGHARATAEREAIQKLGHRVGVDGVDSMRGVINETQSFAPYVADKRLLSVVEHFFGPWIRISCTDCVINRPGCGRGYWHSDWPYNQTNASHIPAPYPDVLMHLATIWMLTDFAGENGGTLLVPGSHRSGVNPSDGMAEGVDRDSALPDEIHAEGKAGSVLLYDSRLWHAVAPNQSDSDRVALIIRYAPWWLNLEPTRAGSDEHEMMVIDTDGKDYNQPQVTQQAYAALPANVQPLYRHWVERG
ncbi:MAG: phytanoyl-CoA dioxygenase [Gemmatimonadetes bacterium]|nr:phytanoyl-CoA dioxygenase [Gemmatimonadota bacterium]MBT7863633.1 phytanoyl-CoA dioxygenase [Gemmatimonadota bacterium]